MKSFKNSVIFSVKRQKRRMNKGLTSPLLGTNHYFNNPLFFLSFPRVYWLSAMYTI